MYMGLIRLDLMVGPAIAPVLGGILSQFWAGELFSGSNHFGCDLLDFG